MALLSFVESAPRADRLQVGNAAPSEIQQHPGHALLQLADQRCPVGLGTAALPLPYAGAREQKMLQNIVGQLPGSGQLSPAVSERLKFC